MVLTDHNYMILALLRVHEFESLAEGDTAADNGLVKIRVGNVYPVSYTTTLTNKVTDSSHPQSKSILNMTGEEAVEWTLAQLQSMLESKNKLDSSTSETATRKKSNKIVTSTTNATEQSITLKALLLRPSSGVFHFGPSVIEHCILHTKTIAVQTKITPTLIRQGLVMPPASWNALIQSLNEEGSRILYDFQAKESKGFIFYKLKVPLTIEQTTTSTSEDSTSTIPTTLPHSDKVFEDFQPHLLHQHQGRPFLEYPTFSQAVDEFFSLLEGQRRTARVEAAEVTARQKLEKIRLDQARRLHALHNEASVMFQHAKLIELFADDVDKALGVINSAVASGMDWESLEQLVAVEKAHDNPIALLIHQLALGQDQIVISLPDTFFPGSTMDGHEMNELTMDTPIVLVHIPLSVHENAHGNARLLYEKYRLAKEKADKTMEASSKALKAAEATAQKQLSEAQRSKKVLSSLTTPRKVYWFEKFYWFITTENYLVLAGRDAQQNEVLVKKYLRQGDAYVHADIHGAASCILRGKRQRVSPLPHQSSKVNTGTVGLPLSEQALAEAGNFAICRSSAWSSKIITSAW